MEKFSRRNFISTAAKFLAGAAVFSIAPNFTSAAEKNMNDEKIIPLEETILSPAKAMEKVLPFDMPKLKNLKTLGELKVSAPKLKFVDEMGQRRYTSAIVIHHAGMSRNEDMTLNAIHKLHLGNGWSGVGYHFVVHKNGVIEHARPMDRIGAHAYAHNRYSVGICMTGNLDIGVPTYEQTLATEKLIAALCHRYDIIPKRDTIFGHRDLCDTSCPGYNFYPRIPELIENVAAVL